MPQQNLGEHWVDWARKQPRNTLVKVRYYTGAAHRPTDLLRGDLVGGVYNPTPQLIIKTDNGEQAIDAGTIDEVFPLTRR